MIRTEVVVHPIFQLTSDRLLGGDCEESLEGKLLVVEMNHICLRMCGFVQNVLFVPHNLTMDRHTVQEKTSVSEVVKMRVAIALWHS